MAVLGGDSDRFGQGRKMAALRRPVLCSQKRAMTPKVPSPYRMLCARLVEVMIRRVGQAPSPMCEERTIESGQSLGQTQAGSSGSIVGICDWPGG